jgi:hypothetical protein
MRFWIFEQLISAVYKELSLNRVEPRITATNNYRDVLAIRRRRANPSANFIPG